MFTNFGLGSNHVHDGKHRHTNYEYKTQKTCKNTVYFLEAGNSFVPDFGKLLLAIRMGYKLVKFLLIFHIKTIIYLSMIPRICGDLEFENNIVF
jgi:hypothetical protein